MRKVNRQWLGCVAALVLGCSAAEPTKNRATSQKVIGEFAYPIPVPIEETLSDEEGLIVERPSSVSRTPAPKPVFQITCEKGSGCTAAKINEWGKTLSAVAKALEAHFGPAVVNGVVRVQVGAGLGTGAQTIWRSTGGGPRLVRVLEVHFWKEERHILAHELFHALYQQDAFIQSLPDTLIEGSATYAEYRYRYAGKPQEEIAKTMLQQIKALGQTKPFDPAVYNRAFGIQPDDEKARLYIASGLLFMGLTEQAAKQAISTLLHRSARPTPVAIKTLEDASRLITLSVSPEVFAWAPPSSAAGALQRYCDVEGPLETSAEDHEMRNFILQIMDKTKYYLWKKNNCAATDTPPPTTRRSSP